MMKRWKSLPGVGIPSTQEQNQMIRRIWGCRRRSVSQWRFTADSTPARSADFTTTEVKDPFRADNRILRLIFGVEIGRDSAVESVRVPRRDVVLVEDFRRCDQ